MDIGVYNEMSNVFTSDQRNNLEGGVRVLLHNDIDSHTLPTFSQMSIIFMTMFGL